MKPPESGAITASPEGWRGEKDIMSIDDSTAGYAIPDVAGISIHALSTQYGSRAWGVRAIAVLLGVAVLVAQQQVLRALLG